MNRVFYEFYIFNNKDKLLFYLDFDNLKENSNEDPSLNFGEEQVHKLENTVGISKALKSFVQKLSPFDIVNFNYFESNKYKYSIYEELTGIKLILLSCIDNNNYQELLQQIYQNNYLEYVNRNILYQKGSYIDIPQFKKLLIKQFKDHFTLQIKKN